MNKPHQAAAVDLGELLPTDQAAKVVHQKPSTLIAWRCAGIGPVYFKLGRRCFYRRDDLVAWIAAQRREPTEVAKAAGAT